MESLKYSMENATESQWGTLLLYFLGEIKQRSRGKGWNCRSKWEVGRSWSWEKTADFRDHVQENQITEEGWDLRRGSCRFRIWVERLEYWKQEGMQYTWSSAQENACMNRLGDGSSFLVIFITSKLLSSALTEDPRLASISLFLQENEANPLEKRINTDSLLWTQQFQCRSTL